MKIKIKADHQIDGEVDIVLSNDGFDNQNYVELTIGDIEKWQEWNIDWKSIDLVMGGSPCQGFSFAGKQLNFNDPRSRLFFVFADIVRHKIDWWKVDLGGYQL